MTDKKYDPKPVDTSDVILPEELLALTDRIQRARCMGSWKNERRLGLRSRKRSAEKDNTAFGSI